MRPLLQEYNKRIGKLQILETQLKERIKKLTAQVQELEARHPVQLYSWETILKDPGVLKKETDAGLRLAHAVAHAWWRHPELRPKGMTKDQVKRYYELVVAEMKRRGMHTTELGAPVYSIRDKPMGQPVTVDDLKALYSEPIVLREGVIKVVGGIPNWGSSKGDIDIMIDLPPDTPESILHPIRFRLGRAVSPDLSWRLQFLDPSNNQLMGPFTNHLTLYDLVLVPHHRFVEMSGTIELLTFVPVPKTSVGYHEGEVTEIEQVVARFKPEDYPLVCEKKYDGLVVEWHKKGDKIVAFTDAGKRCEHRFPSFIKTLREHPCPELLLLTETEGWKDGKHIGREEIAGYVHEKGTPDDSNIVANVWDVLWCRLPQGVDHHDLQPEGDVHEWPLEQRIRLRELVASLGKWQRTDEVPKPGWNNVPSHELKEPNPGELKKLLTKIRNLPGSEGVMIKSTQDSFPLTGHISSWVKYKKSADLHVVVLKRNSTKTPGVYNYYVGLLASKDMPHVEPLRIDSKEVWVMNVGKTSNIARKFERGDIITVMPHTLFKYPDGRLVIYESPIYEKRPDQKLPDTVQDAIRIAEKAGILQTKALAAAPKLRYALQLHFRGKSVHGDLRLEKEPGGDLEGFTLNLDEGKIEQPVTTLKQAREVEKHWSKYLEPLDPGHQILAEHKADEPHEWLDVDNRVDPPGGVIATKNYPGVMIITDKGTYERGALKPYYKEFFFHGSRLKGRYVFRLLHLRGEPVWMFWKTKTEEPYVLSLRAIREGWYPKEGSALPKELEDQVPEHLRYWEVTGEERDKRRKELRKLWLKKFAQARWLLQYQWWKGQFVKRRGPSKQVYLFRAIRDSDMWTWEMPKDPRRGPVPGILHKSKYDEYIDIGKDVLDIPPGTKYNPTKATPSHLMTLDSGKLSTLQESPLVIKFRLRPELTFIATRTSPDEDIWTCQVTA